MCFNNRQPYVHIRFHDQFVVWYQNSYMKCVGLFGGLGLLFGLCGILWGSKYWAWWRSWAEAVTGIPCNSDFGTSNKIRTNWEGRVVRSCNFWVQNGHHALSSESKKLLVRHQWVVHTKNVGVWYLCRLASKNLSDLRVPPRSSSELRSSMLLCSE